MDTNKSETRAVWPTQRDHTTTGKRRRVATMVDRGGELDTAPQMSAPQTDKPIFWLPNLARHEKSNDHREESRRAKEERRKREEEEEEEEDEDEEEEKEEDENEDDSLSSGRERTPLARNSQARRGKSCSAPQRGPLELVRAVTWRVCVVMSVFVCLSICVYFLPLAHDFTVQPKVAPHKPRPKYSGALAINDQLDSGGEKLWENQFHAPESLAWTKDKRRFFTGVEGGFILLVEPYSERWTVIARLNSRLSIQDQTGGVRFKTSENQYYYLDDTESSLEPNLKRGDNNNSSSGSSSYTSGAPKESAAKLVDLIVPFCRKDIEMYGRRAEFEPALVRLSRCSRPLGLRLSPDQSRLYVVDPLSGLYMIRLHWADSSPSELAHSKLTTYYSSSGNTSTSTSTSATATATASDSSLVLAHSVQPSSNHVSKLLNFSNDVQHRPTKEAQVYFGDDLAVDFHPNDPKQDVIYFTDCSRRWTLRYLIWMMLENDDSGRVMKFEVGIKQLSKVDNVAPTIGMEARNLSFPNGIELTANGSALLLSDLNNRRILMHHIKGPLRGQTKHLMWVPGFSDNIKRGLDGPSGEPTYWFACGCALTDGPFELFEFANPMPWLKKLLLHYLYWIGALFDLFGWAFNSTLLRDVALQIGSVWLKHDPYCAHGLVAQFNERGQILRSLHGPKFGSNFKLLSEASQVPNLNTRSSSTLYLGSVYYSYLGRVELFDDEPSSSAH